MIIRHKSPLKGWTKIDRYVLELDMSDGAKVLYAYMCGLRNGAAYVDAYLLKALKCSQATLTLRKRELKDKDLLLVDQVQPRVYVAYIGHSKVGATQVKAEWKKEDALL